MDNQNLKKKKIPYYFDWFVVKNFWDKILKFSMVQNLEWNGFILIYIDLYLE